MHRAIVAPSRKIPGRTRDSDNHVRCFSPRSRNVVHKVAAHGVWIRHDVRVSELATLVGRRVLVRPTNLATREDRRIAARPGLQAVVQESCISNRQPDALDLIAATIALHAGVEQLDLKILLNNGRGSDMAVVPRVASYREDAIHAVPMLEIS